jgi:hypothetical protein
VVLLLLPGLALAAAPQRASAAEDPPNPAYVAVLFKAATEGELATVQGALMLGVPADAVANDRGQTALMAAAAKGRVAVVRFLLEKGADPNKKDAAGNAALAYARSSGNAEIIALLENKGGGRAAAAPRPRPASGSRPAQKASTPVRPRAASGGTLYLQARTNPSGTELTHWLLLPAGRVYQGVPPGGVESFDFAAARAAEPKQCGTYTVSGGKMHIVWGGGRAAESLDYAAEADGNLRIEGLFAKRVGRFPAGHRLSGEYYGGGAVGGGTGSFVSSSRTLRFRADGTFTSKDIGGVAFSGNGYDGSAVSRGESSGTYQISGNTLILRHANGTVTRHTVYPYAMGPKEWINVDGGMMKPQ